MRYSIQTILLACIAAVLITNPFALIADTGPRAPFSNELELREFSDMLVEQIGIGALEAAKVIAIDNSHLDDEIAQRNITETFELLPGKLISDDVYQTQYVETSKFGRSFIRHQYAFDNADQALRCMLTYRRKTDGWRLNQIWCF